MEKEKGFTLIELLVVISIIALLLSILMPALTKVKEQAMFVVGANNVKQVGLAEMVFTNDNEEYYSDSADCFGLSIYTITQRGLDPISGNWYCRWHNEEENNINRPDIAGQLWPYLQNQKVVMCPLYMRLAKIEGEGHNNHSTAVPMKPQYAFSQNAFLGNLDEFRDNYYIWATDYIASKVSHVSRPAKIFMFAEENFEPINTSLGYNFTWTNDTLNDTMLFAWGSNFGTADIDRGYTNDPGDSAGSLHKCNRDTFEGRESGVAHAVFADGHFGTMHPWETQKYASPKLHLKDMPH